LSITPPGPSSSRCSVGAYSLGGAYMENAAFR